MKKWILGLWILGYSLAAQGGVVEWDVTARRPVYKPERLQLGLNNQNIPPETEQPPQDPPPLITPVRMGKMNFTVAKSTFRKDQEGRIIVSVERTNCAGTTEAPIYDVRELKDGYAIEYTGHTCIATLYGKKTKLNIQGYIILDKNPAGVPTANFVGGMSYMVPALKSAPGKYEYGYTGFSTKSEIRDGTFSLYPAPKLDFRDEKKIEVFSANVELVDEQ